MNPLVRSMLDAAIANGDLTLDDLAAYTAQARPDVPTVAEAVVTLERHTGLSSRTLRTYRPHWRRLIAAYGDLPVTQVRDMQLADLAVQVRCEAARGPAGPAGHLNDGHRAHISFLNATRAVFADAYRRLGLDPRTSPAHRVKIPARRPNPARRALSDQELLDLFDVVRTESWDPRLHVLILRALLESGARRTALMTVTLGDVDPARATMTVTTNNQVRRELLLGPDTVAAIHDLAAERGSTSPYDPALRNKSGSPANDHTFDRLFALVRRRLPWARRIGLSAHHLRHTHGTRMERCGSPAVAAASLGHTLPGATAIYTRATDSEVVRVWETVFQTPHPLGGTGA